MNLAKAELVVIEASFEVLKPLQRKFNLSDDAIEGLCQSIATSAMPGLTTLDNIANEQPKPKSNLWRVTDGGPIDDKPVA